MGNSIINFSAMPQRTKHNVSIMRGNLGARGSLILLTIRTLRARNKTTKRPFGALVARKKTFILWLITLKPVIPIVKVKPIVYQAVGVLIVNFQLYLTSLFWTASLSRFWGNHLIVLHVARKLDQCTRHRIKTHFSPLCCITFLIFNDVRQANIIELSILLV